MEQQLRTSPKRRGEHGFLRAFRTIMRLAVSRGNARTAGLRRGPEKATAHLAECVTGGEVSTVVLVLAVVVRVASDRGPVSGLWEGASHRFARCAGDQGQLGGVVNTAMQPTESLPPPLLQIVGVLFGVVKFDRVGTKTLLGRVGETQVPG
jgi:hypothetical protein